MKTWNPSEMSASTVHQAAQDAVGQGNIAVPEPGPILMHLANSRRRAKWSRGFRGPGATGSPAQQQLR